jgi:hypothetical protein
MKLEIKNAKQINNLKERKKEAHVIVGWNVCVASHKVGLNLRNPLELLAKFCLYAIHI